MHYEVRFSGSPAEKTSQAWAETKQWLGAEGLARLTKVREDLTAARADRRGKCRWARDFCDLNGVGGYYPRRAVKGFMLGLIEPPRSRATRGKA